MSGSFACVVVLKGGAPWGFDVEETSHGALRVTEVLSSSNRPEGLCVGDVIMTVNDVRCRTLDEAYDMIEGAFRTLTLLVWRTDERFEEDDNKDREEEGVFFAIVLVSVFGLTLLSIVVTTFLATHNKLYHTTKHLTINDDWEPSTTPGTTKQHQIESKTTLSTATTSRLTWWTDEPTLSESENTETTSETISVDTNTERTTKTIVGTYTEHPSSPSSAMVPNPTSLSSRTTRSTRHTIPTFPSVSLSKQTNSDTTKTLTLTSSLTTTTSQTRSLGPTRSGTSLPDTKSTDKSTDTTSKSNITPTNKSVTTARTTGKITTPISSDKTTLTINSKPTTLSSKTTTHMTYTRNISKTTTSMTYTRNISITSTLSGFPSNSYTPTYKTRSESLVPPSSPSDLDTISSSTLTSLPSNITSYYISAPSCTCLINAVAPGFSVSLSGKLDWPDYIVIGFLSDNKPVSRLILEFSAQTPSMRIDLETFSSLQKRRQSHLNAIMETCPFYNTDNHSVALTKNPVFVGADGFPFTHAGRLYVVFVFDVTETVLYHGDTGDVLRRWDIGKSNERINMLLIDSNHFYDVLIQETQSSTGVHQNKQKMLRTSACFFKKPFILPYALRPFEIHSKVTLSGRCSDDPQSPVVFGFELVDENGKTTLGVKNHNNALLQITGEGRSTRLLLVNPSIVPFHHVFSRFILILQQINNTRISVYFGKNKLSLFKSTYEIEPTGKIKYFRFSGRDWEINSFEEDHTNVGQKSKFLLRRLLKI